jgi:hypothetical protein
VPQPMRSVEKGTAIMKLTTTTMVTVDGGFERGGWVTPLFDNEAATAATGVG